MSEPNWTPQELYPLWLRAHEEPVDESELQRLNELLASDPIARERVIELSQQQAWLMWHGSCEEECDDEAMARRVEAAVAKVIAEQLPASGVNPGAAAITPDSTPFGWTTSWRFGATFCLGFVVAMIASQGWWRNAPAPGAGVRNSMPVGYLAMDNGCVWGGDGLRTHVLGGGVRQGDEISLQEGIAEFRMASGVFLSVEGPAALVLTSESSLVLQYGKITAHVPWTVTDFKAVVGTCEVAASDCEFGVSFLGRDVELHTFTGEAVATDPRFLAGDLPTLHSEPDTAFLARTRVPQGQSLKLVQDADGMKVLAEERSDEVRFATRLPMAWPLPVTAEYVDTVLRSNPVGYWRFESAEGGVVRSEVATGCVLDVVGDLRLVGDEDNRVAEFNRPGISSRLISREPTDILSQTDYSVEVWIKPSHLHCGGAVALLATPPAVNAESHAFYLELQGARGRGMCSNTHPGCVRFVHRDPPGRDFAVGKSCLSTSRYRLRRWQHVVAVKQGAEMRLYLDGEIVGREHVETQLAPRLRLVVGQPQSDAPRDFWFIGQLDELALYDHALSEEEVVKHYRAISWDPERHPELLKGI